ncbi:hypothetical protein E2C01_098613 [Portunus trituberculatus]|uniref:Uncharacterized protein n=1 Tax=Portunus trituberculatus TaxID=210409 RepID=A0A5B7K7E8_PORTR|nr:hypothetical protein [Portunus trituberculatus]
MKSRKPLHFTRPSFPCPYSVLALAISCPYLTSAKLARPTPCSLPPIPARANPQLPRPVTPIIRV